MWDLIVSVLDHCLSVFLGIRYLCQLEKKKIYIYIQSNKNYKTCYKIISY